MKFNLIALSLFALINVSTYSNTNLDFSGTSVEWRTKFFDSNKGLFSDDSEADLLLNARWNVNPNLALNFEIDTDETTFADEHGDDTVSMTFIYDNLSDFEIALDIEVKNQNGTRFTIDEGSESTYLKWKFKEDAKLGFYPYNIGTDLGDEFETDYTAQLPGVVYEKENFYAGIGGDATDGETIMAFKIGYSFNSEKQNYTLDYTNAFGGVETYNTAVGNGAFGGSRDPIAIQQVLNFQGTFSLENNMKLLIESGITTASDDLYDYLKSYNTDINKSGLGIFAKLSNKVDKYYPYASGKYVSESFLFDDDESILTAINNGGEGYHGGLIVFAFGVDYPLHENINFNSELEFKKSKNNVYLDTNDNTTDTNISIALGVKGEL